MPPDPVGAEVRLTSPQFAAARALKVEILGGGPQRSRNSSRRVKVADKRVGAESRGETRFKEAEGCQAS